MNVDVNLLLSFRVRPKLRQHVEITRTKQPSRCALLSLGWQAGNLPFQEKEKAGG
jgi:hypothetical protein